jgi:hypothetical protein
LLNSAGCPRGRAESVRRASSPRRASSSSRPTVPDERGRYGL